MKPSTPAVRTADPCLLAPLQTLADHLPTARAVLLSRSDGFEVASVISEPVSVSRLAAISSSMLALGRAALRELGPDDSGTLLIDGQLGKLLMLEVEQSGAPPLVLTITGNNDLVTGKLLWAAKNCAQQLLEISITKEQA